MSVLTAISEDEGPEYFRVVAGFTRWLPNQSEIDLGMSINNNSNPIKGNIVFDGLRVENSKWSAIWSKKTLEAYHVTIKNAVIKNVSTSSNLAAIHVGLLSYGNTSYANMGGYTLYILDTGEIVCTPCGGTCSKMGFRTF